MDSEIGVILKKYAHMQIIQSDIYVESVIKQFTVKM